MKIYEMKIAPNPRRVRIFLAEKGVDVEYVELDLQKGDNLTPKFRQMNLMTKVPVLELDNGACISETVAICRYFEEIHPEAPLMGTTAIEKAQIEMWQRWLEFYFLLPTGMCFQHSSGYFKDRMTPIKEWADECKKNARMFFDTLNTHLADKTFIVTEQFSIADITALCTIDFNKVNNLRIEPEHEHLSRWYQRISSRPSAKA
ncbi:MAG: glutathione S-transferase [Gammaproteobacteria bacterium]|nr:MAG: glutathione S-transferase [Gammaproteobacteria bacterium]